MPENGGSQPTGVYQPVGSAGIDYIYYRSTRINNLRTKLKFLLLVFFFSLSSNQISIRPNHNSGHNSLNRMLLCVWQHTANSLKSLCLSQAARTSIRTMAVVLYSDVHRSHRSRSLTFTLSGSRRSALELMFAKSYLNGIICMMCLILIRFRVRIKCFMRNIPEHSIFTHTNLSRLRYLSICAEIPRK